MPDDWQQMVLDDWLAETGGRWSSLTCGLSVPRQNGKNALLEIRELFGMVGRGERILHTAHEVKTAQKHFRRLMYFFGSSADDPGAQFPELNALVSDIRRVNGQEAVLLKNGGSVELVARSKNSGRGFTVDVLVMDEAQEMSEDSLEALMPTTSAAPSGNPQWILTGTPPGPKADGEVFTRVRAEALAGHSKRLAWHEWSCQPGVNLNDHEAWHAANPALGTRLQFDVVEGERSRFSDDGFARERLGMWDELGSHRVIDEQLWSAVADVNSVAIDRKTLAVDVAPNRSRASVSLAGRRPDGLWHMELYAQHEGVDWVPSFIEQKAAKNKLHAVVADVMSGLVEERRGRHYLTGTDVEVTVAAAEGRDMAIACAGYYDAVVAGRVRHTDQPQVNVALSVAGKRPVAGAWAWNRRAEDSDITPVVSQTLALWGAQQDKVKRPSRRSTSERRAVLL